MCHHLLFGGNPPSARLDGCGEKNVLRANTLKRTLPRRSLLGNNLSVPCFAPGVCRSAFYLSRLQNGGKSTPNFTDGKKPASASFVFVAYVRHSVGLAQ